jgi:hypothetical protein
MTRIAPLVGQTRKSVQVITADEYDAAARLNPDASPLAAAGDCRSGRTLLADAEADAQLSMSAVTRTPRGRAVLGRLVSLARTVRDRFRRRAAAAAAAASAAAAAAGSTSGCGGPWRMDGGLGESAAAGAGRGPGASSSNPRADAAADAAAAVGCDWAGRGAAESLQWAAADEAGMRDGGVAAAGGAALAVERPLRTRAMVLVDRRPPGEPASIPEAGARPWWADPIMRRFWTYGHRVRRPTLASHVTSRVA